MCAASGERYRSRLLSMGVGLAVGVEGVVEGGLESSMAVLLQQGGGAVA